MAGARCQRLGVTLAADTRGCTLPAGHGGHHECYGDRLWGVDGWGSDEASDYRRATEIRREFEREVRLEASVPGASHKENPIDECEG